MTKTMLDKIKEMNIPVGTPIEINFLDTKMLHILSNGFVIFAPTIFENKKKEFYALPEDK